MSLTLRPATLEDATLLLAWRNDPVTRANFIHSEPVSLDEHMCWLRRTLSGDAKRLYVAVEDGRPVATARLDRAGVGAEISITVAPEHRGSGVMTRLLPVLIEEAQRLGLKELTANVKGENVASLRGFLRAGFVLEGHDFIRLTWRGETTRASRGSRA